VQCGYLRVHFCIDFGGTPVAARISFDRRTGLTPMRRFRAGWGCAALKKQFHR